MHLAAKLADRLGALALASRNVQEVLQQLRPSLLLDDERQLHGAVQEFTDDLEILLGHVPRRERRGAKANAAWGLGRFYQQGSATP